MESQPAFLHCSYRNMEQAAPFLFAISFGESSLKPQTTYMHNFSLQSSVICPDKIRNRLFLAALTSVNLSSRVGKVFVHNYLIVSYDHFQCRFYYFHSLSLSYFICLHCFSCHLYYDGFHICTSSVTHSLDLEAGNVNQSGFSEKQNSRKRTIYEEIYSNIGLWSIEYREN